MNKFNPCAGRHTLSQDSRHSGRTPRTIDEARLIANVNARSQRLFQDGYTGRRLTASTVRVSSPHGEEYCVDQESGECDCPFFTKHLGKYACKHLMGIEKLLSDQKAIQTRNSREWAAMAGVLTHRAGVPAPRSGVLASRHPRLAQGGAWK